VEVARRFPTTLNPTIWLDMRPLNYGRVPGHGGPDQKDAFVNISYRQPIELGNQTQYRYEIAKAAYDQARWGIVQAEVLALVQTFRFFETAAYRREKLKLAERLAQFNAELVSSLQKALQENLVLAADVRIAEVELRALQQQVETARQEYAIALADLHNQLGTPETAGTAEPFGEFALPSYIPEVEDERLVQFAVRTRPEIHAARSQVEGARAAVKLAQGDRIPTIVAGPEYQRNESGTDFYGFIFVMPLPIVNDGTPLVRQREAELRRACIALQQIEQRTVAQVRTAVAKWNAAQRLLNTTADAVTDLDVQIDALEKLFQENQIDITKLLQARQRLIQLENAKLDAIWQATQAQADLLTALGASNLLEATRSQRPN
jgi:cobalt-zinc-cadmium efflux system outer membrane protein